jgi:hypothetical protein
VKDVTPDQFLAVVNEVGESIATAFMAALDITDTPLLLIRDLVQHVAEDLDPAGAEYLRDLYSGLETANHYPIDLRTRAD